MKTFEDINYKLDKDNIFNEYIRTFKYIWDQCIYIPDEIIIKYDNNTANFIYKMKDVLLQVLITKDNKINYEITCKNETKRYEFKIKEDFVLYEDFKNYLFYHFDRLIKSCYNCATDTKGYFKIKNVDGIHKYYRDML